MTGRDKENQSLTPATKKNVVIKVGDMATLTSGEFSGYEVTILAIDGPNDRATVAFAMFGGIDANPFEVELTSLRPGEQ